MSDTLTLSERLDTQAAVSLATELSNLPTSSHVKLNCGQVAHFGAQAVQVIVSAHRSFRNDGGGLELIDVSEKAVEQLGAMGLSAETMMETPQ